MNEIQHIDRLTKASVDMAQAVNDYGTNALIVGVFMVMVLLMVIALTAQVYFFQRKLGLIYDSCTKAMEYFSALNNRTVGREEAKMIVRMCFSAMESNFKYNILKMRKENHLDDKDMAEMKIRDIVTTRFSETKILLSRFMCTGHSVNFSCTDGNLSDLIKLMSKWVFVPESSFTVSLMAQGITLYFDRMYIEASAKIDDV